MHGEFLIKNCREILAPQVATLKARSDGFKLEDVAIFSGVDMRSAEMVWGVFVDHYLAWFLKVWYGTLENIRDQ